MKSADRGLRARLDRIFEARSVALVGVSANPRKLNGAPLPILKVSGFAGEIWPVNPKYAEIDGLRCYPEVAALPASPDVALVLAPAREVPDVLAALAARDCRSAVVVSSGFEEFEGGGALAERLREVCERESMALIGPNCEGVWSVRSRVMLTFGSAAKRAEFSHAPIAILSQSGAIGGAIARHLQDSGTGCAYLVSVGNETAIGILDYLDYMIERDDVRVVLLFTEGLQDGGRLLALAERARARGIVLIALKSGNSQLGRAAVASHTGKVATDSGDLSRRLPPGRHHRGRGAGRADRSRGAVREHPVATSQWRGRGRSCRLQHPGRHAGADGRPLRVPRRAAGRIHRADSERPAGAIAGFRSGSQPDRHDRAAALGSGHVSRNPRGGRLGSPDRGADRTTGQPRPGRRADLSGDDPQGCDR